LHAENITKDTIIFSYPYFREGVAEEGHVDIAVYDGKVGIQSVYNHVGL